MATQYAKLKDLQNFKVLEDNGYSFKKWNVAERRMEVSETYQEGFRKMHALTIDQGILELSSSQLGQMLTSAYNKGRADIIGCTFNVKTNGKQGEDIRYFINKDYTQSGPTPETPQSESIEVSESPTFNDGTPVPKPEDEFGSDLPFDN